MSRNLCDETFPASLLIEFDELDDEIPLSPEHPVGAFPRRHHSTTLSGAPGAMGSHHADDRSGSRTVISGSSNTSSGHSSLSTEGENRSASSERDTSRDASKRQTAADGAGQEGAAGPGAAGQLLLLKPRKFRPPRSMESLLQGHAAAAADGGSRSQQHRTLTQSPRHDGGRADERAGGGGSSGNLSGGGSGGSQPPPYHRNRAKYGHVQSKVKQLIDEMKPNSGGGGGGGGGGGNLERKSLVRHKSMPNTYDGTAQDEDDAALDRETDLETLRAIIREMKERAGNLERQLNVRNLFHESAFNELAALKCKNSALRMENDQLREQERAREQRRQVLRQGEQQHAGSGSCYGSQSSLHRASLNVVCSVGTQTSPGHRRRRRRRVDDFTDSFTFPVTPTTDRRSQRRPSPRGGGSSNSKSSSCSSIMSAGRKGGAAARTSIVGPAQPAAAAAIAAATTSSAIIDHEQRGSVVVVGEFSPDYDQLVPMLGRTDDSSSFLHDLRYRDRGPPAPVRSAAERSVEGQEAGCRDCRKRRKKRQSRKQKLASLFCIRRHDESL